MKKLKEVVVLRIDGDYEPLINIGQTVSPGDKVANALIRKVLEYHDISKAKLLVDSGLLVRKGTPLLERSVGMYKEIAESDFDGVTKITGNRLEILAGEESKQIMSDVWGRVLKIDGEGIWIEALFTSIPMLISQGNICEANISILNSRQIEIDEPENTVIIIPGTVTREQIDNAIEIGVAGIISASISWKDYLYTFKKSKINVGILQGCGIHKMWNWLEELLTNASGCRIIADFSKSMIKVAVSDIILDSIPRENYLFKDLMWGRKISELLDVSGQLIGVLENKEKVPILHEEILISD